MAYKPAPHARQVSVRELATGTIVQLWAVDARERVSTGGWEYVRANDPSPTPAAAPAAVPDPAAPPSAEEILRNKSLRELKKLAKASKIDDKLPREQLEALLLPHVKGGAVSLEKVPDLAIPSAQFPNAQEAD